PLVVTEPDRVLGSPLFMAPEQLAGEGAVDARADLWAMGCILFRLVGGKTPFEAGTLAELVVAIRTREVPPLSKVAEVPAAFEAVVAKCLRRDLRQRRHLSGANR